LTLQSQADKRCGADRRVLAAMAKETSSANPSLPLHEVLEAEVTALHGALPADYLVVAQN
jgi:hypothetical protein